VQAHTDKSKIAEVADRLRQRHPDSFSAFITWAMTMGDTGRGSVAEAAAKERLERSPRDRAALYALHVLAAGRHDYAASAAYARRIVDELSPTPNDYNEAAWTALFTTRDLERAIEDARRASDEKNANRSAALHTLAAVYAESGRNSDARQALLQSISLRQNDEPESYDWYVFGRIAENYGVADAALAAYRRVEKKPEDATGLSTWELAQRRLALLSPKK
jgi:tetratricopeptide (TPR) repeat protein